MNHDDNNNDNDEWGSRHRCVSSLGPNDCVVWAFYMHIAACLLKKTPVKGVTVIAVEISRFVMIKKEKKHTSRDADASRLPPFIILPVVVIIIVVPVTVMSDRVVVVVVAVGCVGVVVVVSLLLFSIGAGAGGGLAVTPHSVHVL